MSYSSKAFKNNNYFILYDLNDEVVCYFDNSDELLKHVNYDICHIVWLFKRINSYIIPIVIDGKKYKLATFC